MSAAVTAARARLQAALLALEAGDIARAARITAAALVDLLEALTA